MIKLVEGPLTFVDGAYIFMPMRYECEPYNEEMAKILSLYKGMDIKLHLGQNGNLRDPVYIAPFIGQVCTVEPSGIIPDCQYKRITQTLLDTAQEYEVDDIIIPIMNCNVEQECYASFIYEQLKELNAIDCVFHVHYPTGGANKTYVPKKKYNPNEIANYLDY